MSGFSILMTDAGRAAIVATGGTNAVQITEFGYTNTVFTMSPTMTTLPGELGRVDTLAGVAVNDTTIHVTVRDDTANAYTMRGFAFYLDDGTLFAVYGQSTPIMEKSSGAILLSAFDIGVLAGDADLIEFGPANFSYPPASETVKGVAEIATTAEVTAGTDDQRMITPLKLSQRLGTFLTSIYARTIGTSGLATGGGSLAADRTINVPAATAAEADAGTVTTKALTPSSLVNILSSIAAKAIATRQISTSGLATGGGNLTADRTIGVPAASAAEADAGAIADKAVTPASLTNILSSVASKATGGRQISTSGLAAGGGNLTADRTIDVPAASAGDVQAGGSTTKAITPYALRAAQTYASGVNGERIDEFGHIEYWGKVTGTYTSEGVVDVVFPVAFLNACDNVELTGLINAASVFRDLWPQVIDPSITAAGFSVMLQADDGDDNILHGFYYRAIGR
ncbi:MAG: hypothetical protein JWQ16_1760 [Novosphingobium sp.]|nr:hypothetical protein [Novosphingobium sp.]